MCCVTANKDLTRIVMVDTAVHPVSTITVDISVWSPKSRPLGSGRGFGKVKPLEMCVNRMERGEGKKYRKDILCPAHHYRKT